MTVPFRKVTCQFDSESSYDRSIQTADMTIQTADALRLSDSKERAAGAQHLNAHDGR
jgi:hypothetical protein